MLIKKYLSDTLNIIVHYTNKQEEEEMSKKYRKDATYFYYQTIDLTPFFGVRIPKDISRYLRNLEYSFNLMFPIEGEEQKCICFTDFKGINLIQPTTLQRFVKNTEFVVGITKQDKNGLIYKGEILRKSTFVKIDKSGCISSLPYMTHGAKYVLITFHIVYYDPSFL